MLLLGAVVMVAVAVAIEVGWGEVLCSQETQDSQHECMSKPAKKSGRFIVRVSENARSAPC